MPTVYFGSEDIRDNTEGLDVFTCVRVYENPSRHERCGSKHTSRRSALKCANRLARGVVAGGGESYVEICSLSRADEVLAEKKQAQEQGSESKKSSQELLMETFRDLWTEERADEAA